MGSETTRRVAVQAGLVLLTLAVYAQALRFDFVRLDDFDYVVDNPRVLGGPTPANLRWALTTFHEANWHPLTWFSLMLDAAVWGRPAGFHATNVALHLAATLLLLHALTRLTGEFWRSAFVAALFAVHPLHVESVAWISERKDVLSVALGLLALLAWSDYVRRGSWPSYLGTSLAFALALSAKPMLVTLPLLLWLLDLWPLERRATLEKLPLLLLSLASACVTFVAQSRAGTVGGWSGYPLGTRLANALVSGALYLGKTLWPFDLAAFYPYDPAIPPLAVACAAAVLLAVTATVLAGARRRPALAIGWAWFAIALVPVSGLIQVGLQARADRYTYLPSIGLFLMVAWSVPARRVGCAAAVLLVLAASWRAHAQARTWRDSRTLFTHMLRVTGPNPIAYAGLGDELSARGEAREALEHYRRAVALAPGVGVFHAQYGRALAGVNDLEAAAREYRQALAAAPDDPDLLADLAIVAARAGRAAEASALLDPVDPAGHPHLLEARAYVAIGEGRAEEALHLLRRAA
ncbi:MAG TPA: tetratricopeptide repeat protein, partial [Candidatus Polarisedimenticolaceae bacterium]|nr:tetratricopeptide repeat protein [Candidatus Polarisedimenticolaceae bacterium]